MSAPTREQREEWRKHAESDRVGVPWMYSGSVLALLDALDAAEEEIAVLSDVAETNTAAYEHATERVAAVRALASGWANQPTDYDDDTEQQIEDGRMLLAVLDGRKRDHWEDS